MSMKQLTATQRAALALDKNIAVTAGAGTGKTLILVERYISILLQKNVDLRTVLAITFTNKAADEIQARLNNIRGVGSGRIKTGTFHSVCYGILQERYHAGLLSCENPLAFHAC